MRHYRVVDAMDLGASISRKLLGCQAEVAGASKFKEKHGILGAPAEDFWSSSCNNEEHACRSSPLMICLLKR